jgi:hypothetical protein
VPVPETVLPILPLDPSGTHPGGAADVGKQPLRRPCPICSADAIPDPQFLSPLLGETLAYLLSTGGVPPLDAPSGRDGGEPPMASDSVAPSLPDGQRQEGTAAGREGPVSMAAHGPGQAESAVIEGGSRRRASEAGAEQAATDGPGNGSGKIETAPAEVLPEDRDIFEPTGSTTLHEENRDARREEEKPRRSKPGIEKSVRNPKTAEAPEAAEGEEEDEDDDLEEEAPAPPVESSRYQPFRNVEVRSWLPVDAAFGRHDQGVLFLLFIRAITKFLNEIGEIPFQEPFYRYLRVEKLEIYARESKKTGTPRSPRGDVARASAAARAPAAPSRSRLAPGEAIGKYGADALRLVLLGQAPPDRSALVDEGALYHAQRFLGRIWRQITVRAEKGKFVSRTALEAKHRFIHAVTHRLKRFKFHTALAAVHEFVNFLESPATAVEEMDRSALKTFLVVLWPFAPHMAEELWNRLGETEKIKTVRWPEANREVLRTSERLVPVRIDDILCIHIKVLGALEKEKLEAQAVKDERVHAVLAGRPIVRVHAVPDRVVNILVEKHPREKAPEEAAAVPSPPSSPPPATAAPSPPIPPATA